ncbi:UDP-N-acetyl-D-glucosamine dehydrogenase [Bryocella elongata]|uniref:UDP-N-acetyl-D-glucosamine dehydrogenase n=1 Tax=Bryocella elongata TaxID=863522 RepID=A0A1H5XQ54_9BACT|nr:nucleotide sugar dehydrogenase [Bryocella elongata]SEG13783.1 UDP-N-acetyl-D-glucosamine dehydrogenase [Bryocella elongata]
MPLTASSITAAATLGELRERIHGRTARVGVVGLGYVGLPLSLLFAEDGFLVTGFDIDKAKVDTLNAGGSYIHRIEPEHIRAAQASGFHASSTFAEAASLDAILLCVPTPLHADHTPDMSYVVVTIEALAPHLRPGQLVVLESTTWPGTTEEIIVAAIERAGHKVLRSGAPADHTSTPASQPLDGILVAFSPEREDPGNATIPRRSIPKVVGGVDATATAAACALYGEVFASTVPMSSPAAAEMTKLLENIYRAVNIALVNELKLLCARLHIDLWEVIAAAETKPFGFQAFYPGPGVGGHCIPVDPFYLNWKGEQVGFSARFIELAGEINESMPAYVVDSTREALAARGVQIKGAKVLVLGVAYKRDVDDLRESPSLRILELLREAGAEIAYNDPFFPTVGTGRHYELEMTSTPLEDLASFDCVLLATDHSAYDVRELVTRSKLFVDTRNATRGIAAGNIVRC